MHVTTFISIQNPCFSDSGRANKKSTTDSDSAYRMNRIHLRAIRTPEKYWCEIVLTTFDFLLSLFNPPHFSLRRLFVPKVRLNTPSSPHSRVDVVAYGPTKKAT